MSEVFTKQARKSKKGVIFAPGKNEYGYMLFKLCENYDGQIRGGIRKTWRVCKDKLTLEQAKVEFERCLGYKIYSTEDKDKEIE